MCVYTYIYMKYFLLNPKVFSEYLYIFVHEEEITTFWIQTPD